MTDVFRCVPCLDDYYKRHGLNIPSYGMKAAGAFYAETIWNGTAYCEKHYREARGFDKPSAKKGGEA